MIKVSREELYAQISDLECQIEYFKTAEKLQMLDEEQEKRLNSLIIKKATCRFELENLDTDNIIHSFLDKITRIPRKQKRICDYFPPH